MSITLYGSFGNFRTRIARAVAEITGIEYKYEEVSLAKLKSADF
jgi:hypothetical protein